MNVIIVNESIKKANKKAQQIVSDYLKNIGRNTWIGSITEDGLKHLKNDLLEHSSKNMSVACFRITTRQTQNLEWIVGSKKQFDSEGNFAFKYTMKNESQELMLNDYNRDLRNILMNIVYIAGIFHDIGKNYYCFQFKLEKAKNNNFAYMSDPIRHEKISYDVFSTMLRNMLNQSKNRNKALFNSYLKTDLNLAILKELRNSSIDINNFQTLNTNSIIYNYEKILFKSIAHLILTHHKLPSSFDDIKGTNAHSINEDNLVIKKESSNQKTTFGNKESLDKYKQASHQFNDLNDIYDQQFKNQSHQYILKYTFDHFIQFLDKIVQIIENSKYQNELLEYINSNNLLFLTHYILRPSLILADQHFSSKELLESYDFNYNAYANLVNNQLNQTVATHLEGVAKNSRKIARFNLNCIIGKQQLANCPPTKELKKPIPVKQQNKFGWQDDAVESIKNQNIDFDSNFGFFGIVMSKTGSGKTRANAKIMTAINNDDNLRFSVVLGMRTLTLQTYDEYKKELKLKQTIGIIGSSASWQFHNKNKQELNNYEQNIEEDNSIQIYEDNDFIDTENNLPDFLNFQNKKDNKLKKIVQTPITISTIDYFINAINTKSSTRTRYLERLMTSDLIIDEIDMFSEKQSVSIAKLVFLTGFYGRKVILSSATIPKYLIQMYQKAYKAGYDKYCYYSGKSNHIYMGLYTHCPSINETHTIEYFDESKLDSLVQQFQNNIDNEKPKRRTKLVDLKPQEYNDNIDNIYHIIKKHIHFFHDNNQFKKEGMCFSTGLIKFANIKHTVDFSAYLYKNRQNFIDNNILVKLECYHSKHFETRKSYVEKELAKILNRTNDRSNDGFISNEKIQEIIKEAKEKNISNVIILVVSSPIIETGRDFDFDWCIMEPRDHKGIIQTAGRVLRHREKFDKINCGILSHSMKIFDNKDDCLLYNQPGVEFSLNEQNLNLLNENDFYLSKQNKYKSFYDLFEYNQDGDVINSSVSLNTKINKKPIKAIEDNSDNYLKYKPFSFNTFLENEEELLTHQNSANNIFRNQFPEKELIYKKNNFNDFYTENNNSIAAFKGNYINIKNYDFFLINETLDEINHFYSFYDNSYEIELTNNKAIKEFYYNDLLGFRYK